MLKIEEVTGADALKLECIISKEDAKFFVLLLRSYVGTCNYHNQKDFFTKLQLALEAELMEVEQ